MNKTRGSFPTGAVVIKVVKLCSCCGVGHHTTRHTEHGAASTGTVHALRTAHCCSAGMRCCCLAVAVAFVMFFRLF
eukprot:scaffold14682_cov124-Isochrysis_galbana.AAC.13